MITLRKEKKNIEKKKKRKKMDKKRRKAKCDNQMKRLRIYEEKVKKAMGVNLNDERRNI